MIELSCLHGSERYAACFDEVVARAVRFFPTCGVVRVADIKLSRYKGENISLLSLPKKQPCEYQFGEKSCTNFLNEAIEQIE